MGQHAHLYNTTRWRRRRARQLQERPLCKMCEEQGITEPATVADHVVPHRGDFDLFWEGELQSLCATHHSAGKQRSEKRGYSNAIGLDGWPTDPLHPANRSDVPAEATERPAQRLQRRGRHT